MPQRPLWTYTPWIHNILYIQRIWKWGNIWIYIHFCCLMMRKQTNLNIFAQSYCFEHYIPSLMRFFSKLTLSHFYHNLFQLSYHSNICHHSALSALPNFPICIFWIAGYHQFMQLSPGLGFDLIWSGLGSRQWSHWCYRWGEEGFQPGRLQEYERHVSNTHIGHYTIKCKNDLIIK